MAEQTITIPSEHIANVFGSFDENMKVLERGTGTRIISRGDSLTLSGSDQDIHQAARVIDSLVKIAQKGEAIQTQHVTYLLSLPKEDADADVGELLSDVVCFTRAGKPIRPKTFGQKRYVNLIRNNMLTFGIGPAGTGKTYLAMAMAVMALKNREVERIVLTRPAVEAGEKLGFLPGDLTQKVDPYLRPLYDALYDFMGVDAYQKMVDRGTVEVAPLAYMRGRTLSDSFIILDEAQNTTSEQMKMFLTRFGFHSKVVVTGDITQTDLPFGRKSGLQEALDVLEDIPEISIIRLTGQDVVRHELVQRIVEAYAEHASRSGKETERKDVEKA